MYKLFTFWLVYLIFAASAAAQDVQAPRGVYVYSWDIAIQEGVKNPKDAASLIQALNADGVDGITLVESWSAIEPSQGVYEWSPPTPPGQSRFDQWIITAIQSGKKINLAIRAGKDTPATPPNNWLTTTAGATLLTFQVSAHQGAGNCVTVNTAAPWDTALLTEWDLMLTEVARHLKEDITATDPHGVTMSGYDAVKQVRLTGINRTTDEFRLPEEILNTTGCTTNSIDTWLQAPKPLRYRPARLLEAWNKITDSFRNNFPDKFFNVPIIPIHTGQNQNPFPEIDDNGCVYTREVDVKTLTVNPKPCTNPDPLPDQNQPLLALASQKFGDHLVIEFENLTFNKVASPAVVHFAEILGTGVAFMTNNFLALQGIGGAACHGGFKKGIACNPHDYLTLLEEGIFALGPNSLLAQYIEVFWPDVNTTATSSYIQQAHVDLLTPPSVDLVFPDPPTNTGGWFNGPVTGIVTASIDPTVPDVIKDIECTPGNETNKSGLQTPNASADITVATEGSAVKVSCTATSSDSDSALNRSQDIRLMMIDTTPPVTTANVTRLKTGAASVTLAATDNLSGVAQTQYRVNSGPWTAGMDFVLGVDGTYAIWFRSADVAGNVESTKSTTVTVVITPPPCKGKTCV